MVGLPQVLRLQLLFVTLCAVRAFVCWGACEHERVGMLNELIWSRDGGPVTGVVFPPPALPLPLPPRPPPPATPTATRRCPHCYFPCHFPCHTHTATRCCSQRPFPSAPIRMVHHRACMLWLPRFVFCVHVGLACTLRLAGATWMVLIWTPLLCGHCGLGVWCGLQPPRNRESAGHCLCVLLGSAGSVLKLAARREEGCGLQGGGAAGPRSHPRTHVHVHAHCARSSVRLFATANGI